MNPFLTALTNMRRSPYQSLTAILITTITLFVGYSFSLLVMGTEQILQYFETRPQVIAFFDLEAPQNTIETVANNLQLKPYVEDVTVITQEEALKLYREDNKDDPLLLELVTADILPASVEVAAGDLESLTKVKKELEDASGVEEVVFQEDIVDSLTSWTSSVRYLGIAVMAVLLITSFLILSALIGIKVTTKKQAVKIMKVIGASRWFIKAPFFFEGVLYGLVGSLLGWIVMYSLLLYLTPWIRDFLGVITLLPVPWEVLAIQLSVGSLFAMLLGGFAGATAVQKMLR